MVDEGVVSFSVAASFLAAVPCAPSREAGLPSVFRPVLRYMDLGVPGGLPFRLRTAERLLPGGSACRSRADGGQRAHGDGNDRRWGVGLLCAACLTDSSRMETVSTAGRTFVGAGMLACLFWYATARFRSKSAASPGSEAMAALSALIVSSTTFGLVCTVGTGLVWKILVLMYPLNLLLVLAKLAKGSKDAEAGLSNMRRRFRR